MIMRATLTLFMRIIDHDLLFITPIHAIIFIYFKIFKNMPSRFTIFTRRASSRADDTRTQKQARKVKMQRSAAPKRSDAASARHGSGKGTHVFVLIDMFVLPDISRARVSRAAARGSAPRQRQRARHAARSARARHACATPVGCAMRRAHTMPAPRSIMRAAFSRKRWRGIACHGIKRHHGYFSATRTRKKSRTPTSRQRHAVRTQRRARACANTPDASTKYSPSTSASA